MSSPTEGLIFNNNQVSPQRLHAVVKLVVLAHEVSYEMLLKAIQPLTDNQAAARAVVAMARSIGLIQQLPDSDNHYSSKLPVADVENRENFRQVLVHQLLNPTDERDPQFLLSLCAAWYAVQNGAILYESYESLANRFNNNVEPDRLTQQTLNETKVRGWIRWAEFLGWGRLIDRSNQRYLMPDATIRITPIIPTILDTVNQPLPFAQFLHALGEQCPELDTGKLYRYCQPPGYSAPSLSLMLSTALITLENTGMIQMAKVDDSSQVYRLFSGYPTRSVSHIERKV